MPGYQLQAGDAYFREGPFINDFAEISPDTLFGLGGNNATSFGSLGAPYCKPIAAPSADIAQWPTYDRVCSLPSHTAVAGGMSTMRGALRICGSVAAAMKSPRGLTNCVMLKIS